jgi:hypothetical protein
VPTFLTRSYDAVVRIADDSAISLTRSQCSESQLIHMLGIDLDAADALISRTKPTPNLHYRRQGEHWSRMPHPLLVGWILKQ